MPFYESGADFTANRQRENSHDKMAESCNKITCRSERYSGVIGYKNVHQAIKGS